jgi:hypothetical protein
MALREHLRTCPLCEAMCGLRIQVEARLPAARLGHDKPGTRLTVAARHAGVNSNLRAPGMLVDVPSGNAVVNGIPVEVTPASHSGDGTSR